MSHRSFLRCFLLALLGLACAGLEPEPANGQGMIKIWRCRRCGQNLGEGLQRPTYCHNCSSGKSTPWSNPNSSTSSSSPKSGNAKLSLGVVVAVGFVLIIGAAAYILRDNSGPSGS